MLRWCTSRTASFTMHRNMAACRQPIAVLLPRAAETIQAVTQQAETPVIIQELPGGIPQQRTAGIQAQLLQTAETLETVVSLQQLPATALLIQQRAAAIKIQAEALQPPKQ